MQTMRRHSKQYWATPVLGVVIGVAYLVGFSIGGKPGSGLSGLAVMLGFSGGLLLLGRRSETVRGLLEHRDERIAGIDLRATAFTALAMIIAVVVGFVVEISRGNSGWPFDLIGAVGGVAYVGAVGYFRLRH